MPQNLEIEPYYALLRKHDWYYENSDSHQKYQDGHAFLKMLNELAATEKIYKQMLDDFHNHYFSGEPWGTKKKPFPKLEKYLEKK